MKFFMYNRHSTLLLVFDNLCIKTMSSSRCTHRFEIYEAISSPSVFDRHRFCYRLSDTFRAHLCTL